MPLHINFRESGSASYHVADVVKYGGRFPDSVIRTTSFEYPANYLVLFDEVSELHCKADWFYTKKRTHQSTTFTNSKITVFISDFATPEFVRALCADELKEVVSYVD